MTGGAARTRLAVVVYVALALAALTTMACGRASVVQPACTRDEHCGGELACAGNVCVPRAAALQSWAVEISPLPDAPAGFTELPEVALAGSSLDVTAAPKATFAATLAFETPAVALTRAHVVLTVPAAIPGRPDLTFETNLPDYAPGTTPIVTLPIPAGVLGRSGRLDVLPTAPDSAAHAPARYDLQVAPTAQLTLPAKAITIRGRLLSAVGDARTGFIARAFVDGRLVSNAAATGQDGVFTLMIPAGLGPDTGVKVSVELTPPPDAPASSAEPWLSVNPFVLTLSKDLGDLKLPPFSQPNVFRFVAHGHTSDGPTIARAIVRAHTLLDEDPTAVKDFVTDFQRDSLTDADGRASLALLPGSTAKLRYYDLTVIPPPDSLYGTHCIVKFPLSAGGTADAPANVPAIVLPARPLLVGSVTEWGGAPAAGVVIMATRTQPDATALCADRSAAAPATATTRADGVFALPLEPGVYRLDFDPPAGSPFPRLTQTGVIVPASPSSGEAAQVSHAVRLPAGVLLEGSTRDADGRPLPLAGVRLYDVCREPAACGGDAPALLRAQARSDASGHFRVVVAAGSTSGP